MIETETEDGWRVARRLMAASLMLGLLLSCGYGPFARYEREMAQRADFLASINPRDVIYDEAGEPVWIVIDEYLPAQGPVESLKRSTMSRLKLILELGNPRGNLNVDNDGNGLLEAIRESLEAPRVHVAGDDGIPTIATPSVATGRRLGVIEVSRDEDR